MVAEIHSSRAFGQSTVIANTTVKLDKSLVGMIWHGSAKGWAAAKSDGF